MLKVYPVAFKKENSDYYLMIIVGEKCKIALFLLLYKGVLGSLEREPIFREKLREFFRAFQ